MSKRLIAIPYYGGKYSHLTWLLPLLPTVDDGVICYCEPFGGSAAVLLNRKPCPAEVYNDLDGIVVNFFRVLRERSWELLATLSMTPYAREEHTLSIYEEGISDLECARRLYIQAKQSYGSGTLTSDKNSWCALKSSYKKTRTWWNSMRGLSQVAERLANVQFEHRNALDVITKYDSPSTLFYCDPPYVGCDQGYTHTYAYDDWVKLIAVLGSVEGYVAISGYVNDQTLDLLRSWHRFDGKAKVKQSSNKAKVKAVESLWTNYYFE